MDRINLLITGANGFIGKSLVELFDKTKYNIIPIYKPSTIRESTRYEFDLQDEFDVDEMFKIHQNIDFVIHCATVGGRRNKPDTPGIFSCNISMFNNLLKHKDKYKHMYVFGSGAELAEGNFPLNFYGLSKKYITEKIERESLPVTNLRLWGCFGKYETEDRFITANIKRYLNKEDMIIHENKLMDFFYVNDIIPILEYLFHNIYPFSVLNLCYEYKYSLKMICNIINKLKDYKVNISIEKSTNDNYYNKFGMELDEKKFNLIGIEQGINNLFSEIENGITKY